MPILKKNKYQNIMIEKGEMAMKEQIIKFLDKYIIPVIIGILVQVSLSLEHYIMKRVKKLYQA